MALDFPSSPSVNQTYTFGTKTWIWNGSGWALQATAFSNVNGGPFAGTRNRLINGNMIWDQRNGGAAQTITTSGAYTVDRWIGATTGASCTGQRVTGANAGLFRYRFTGAASVTSIKLAQRMESLNTADLAGKTISLSADLANSLLTSATWTLYYFNVADTGGAATQIATGTWTINSTVTRYSAQISVPSAAVTGLELQISVGAQTSGTFTIGDVQLEEGSVATPFERRSVGLELLLCQRYYQSGSVKHWAASANAGIPLGTLFAFNCYMRAAATITLSGGALSNITSTTVEYADYNGFAAYGTTTAGGSAIWQRAYTASAEL